ncbi:hypothetical protein CYMTET_12498 [Cymbomonas tetramitiformis]|uniref:Tyr recombinase domain-containing protein n=1 Tax=Cymbomonas tetramitiformis TaxID=36881 RepID=A0AAE0GLJ8_9CHLO|nr:hypothetical protein CYMTET_12498 [Cymbomonas tetramitiformis]
MRASIWRQDRDDWMLHPALWHELDVELGPFTLDACVAPSRANAYCALSWSREEDARVQAFDGHNTWGNLPFNIMLDILRNFLRCKRRQQLGTSGTFLTEAQRYEGATLADNTKGTYSTGAKAFITFCVYFACLGCMAPLLPATDETLILFITFSSWFVSPDSIKRFCWAKPSKSVVPLTLRNLADMAKQLNFQDINSLSLWATILVGFFGLFRKDNLTEGKAGAWNSRASLVRDDVIFSEDGETVWLRVRYSKTIQCGERCHWVPLRRVPGSALCPVVALRALMIATAGRAGESALFVIEKGTGKKTQLVPMGHGDLVKGLKALAAAVGLNPGDYAGHSLRRGGATAALQLDV